jgi:hypothetical protein
MLISLPHKRGLMETEWDLRVVNMEREGLFLGLIRYENGRV